MNILFLKKTLVLILTLSVSFFYGQSEYPNKNTQSAFGQLDFLSIKMPNNEVNMDFVGIHYNLKPTDWSYIGTGFYGSVGGLRGGFFTLGINAGLQPKITDKLFLDTGIHFGGGGGAAAPDGGGAFIIPHVNLGYNFNYLSATLGWSYINFFDKGAIESNQLYAQLQVPLHFLHSSFKYREKKFLENDFSNLHFNEPSKRISLMVHANNLAVKNTNLKGKTIRLAGFEFNSYFTKNWFYFIKADGAYHGIKAGYMDILLGGGYHLSMNKNRTNLLAKFGVGAGGGGGVDTKGGFLIYPNISIEQKLFSSVYASVNNGYLLSPDRHFISSSLGFGLKYYIDKDGTTSEEKKYRTAKFKGIEAIIQQELYLNAIRDTGISKNMHQIGLQLNLFFNNYIYGAGQTSFANFGDAGAYAEGIIGLGVQSNSFLNDKLSIYAQFLGGAAGGGGIKTGQGLIIKPSIGVNYSLSDKLSLRGGLGYVKARGRSLSSTLANLGVSYRFSLLTSK